VQNTRKPDVRPKIGSGEIKLKKEYINVEKNLLIKKDLDLRNKACLVKLEWTRKTYEY